MELPCVSSTQGCRLTGTGERRSRPAPLLLHCVAFHTGHTLTPSLSHTRGKSPDRRSQEGFLEEGSCGLLDCLLQGTRGDTMLTSSSSSEVDLGETQHPGCLSTVHVKCCCSVAHSCPTFCNPMNFSTPVFCLLHYLPELAQIHVH